MAVQVARIRIGGSKVKTGCRTCKTRRIKCDEALPSCQRCIKSGRVCEGYSLSYSSTPTAIGHRFVHYIVPNQTTVPNPSSSPSPHVDLDAYALRSLDFFLNSTAAQFEQPFGVGIWSQAISCLLHSQPAVKYAAIALAALHENYQHASNSPFAEQRKVLALEHYGKSIGGIVQLRAEDKQKSLGPTLVASLLFCAIESLQGHFRSAMKHIAAGVDLLAQCENDMQVVDGLPSTLFEALSQTFISLAMQVMAMEDTVVTPPLSRYLKQSHLRTDCYFSNIEQALAEVAHLQIDAMRVLIWARPFQDNPDFPSRSLQQAGKALEQRFRSWCILYHDLVKINANFNDNEDYRTRLALVTLQVNQHVTKIIVSVIFMRGQTCFDALVDEFECIVSGAEEIARIESEYASVSGKVHLPMFNMALGIVPAMFYTCVRCRDRSIRNRPLTLLRETKRREAIWDANLVIPVAEAVIAIEEEAAARYSKLARDDGHDQGLGDVEELAHFPEGLPDLLRIERLELDFHDSENSANISLVNMAGTSKHQRILAWDG